MKISTLVIVVGGAPQGEGLWVAARDFRRGSVLIIENTTPAVQLRVLKGGREVKPDVSTRRYGLALQHRLIRQREGRGCRRRAFENVAITALLTPPTSSHPEPFAFVTVTRLL